MLLVDYPMLFEGTIHGKFYELKYRYDLRLVPGIRRISGIIRTVSSVRNRELNSAHYCDYSYIHAINSNATLTCPSIANSWRTRTVEGPPND
jgi:hypothetical protein